jgi:hypothetical protein
MTHTAPSRKPNPNRNSRASAERRRALELLAGSALVIALLAGCSQKEKDPAQVEFEKRFEREAVLVKTCRPDPSVASGASLKVYRFEQELWFNDRGVLRRVDATPDNVCDVLDEPPKR